MPHIYHTCVAFFLHEPTKHVFSIYFYLKILYHKTQIAELLISHELLQNVSGVNISGKSQVFKDFLSDKIPISVIVSKKQNKKHIP